MGGSTIYWKSKKQILIAQSFIEFEFFALTIVGDEAEWLSCFLQDFPLKELQDVITIYCDNQATSIVVADSLFNKKK